MRYSIRESRKPLGDTALSTRVADVLREVSLFAALDPREMEALVARAVEKTFGPGELLFSEGEPCTGMYIVGRGSVKIFKTSPSGREVMLGIDIAPSSVAEVPMFDGGPYPASVSAIGEVTAYHIAKGDFHQLTRQNPELGLKVLAVVGRRLRTLVGLVESLTFGSVRQRLARSLLEFGQLAQADTFPLPVTHEELALRLGTVREVVSRNLSRFQAEGLLKVARREITLLDRAGLEHEAETEL
jgi:CRP/FNR family transcriptional regulator